MVSRVFVLVTLFAAGLRNAAAPVTFQPTEESFKQYVVPEWYRDAKFGIWSHWGPDSVPGISNNYARDMYSQGSADYQWHLAHYGHPSEVGYKDVIASWKAEKFDPDALVAKYKAAGARYIVALATHHDNFDNWNSTYNPWNAVKVGPHKDIVGMWRDATLRAGLRFGVSSHADDRGWNYMWRAHLSDTTGPKAGVPYDGANPAYQSLYNTARSGKEAPPPEYNERWLKRHLELVDRYKPDLLYFDGGGIPHGDFGKQVVAHYLNENIAQHGGKLEAVVDDVRPDFVRGYERGMPPDISNQPFEDETSLAGWFYIDDVAILHTDPHSHSKSAATIIDTLADVVSKNGNLLLNLPQRGDGSLYPECESVLTELAAWMPINGEAIFRTRPWITFGEGPSGLPKVGYMNELMEPLTAEDIRFTTKGDALYAIVLGIPRSAITIHSLAPSVGRIKSVALLGSTEKINWQQTEAGLEIQPAAAWPSRHAVTFKIHLEKS